MNCRLLIFNLLLLICIPVVHAKTDSLRIEIDAPQLKTKQLLLCGHFNGKIYKQDSLVLSSEGKGLFLRKERLPEGLYVIYINSAHYFELLLADRQVFSLQIDTSDFTLKNTISGAEQSEVFLDYVRFISGKQKEQSRLDQELKMLKTNNKDPEKITVSLKLLNEEVLKFQQNFFLKYKNQWVGKFFKGTEPVQTGPYPFPKTQEEALEELQYQKTHFFDHIDLDDPRFWRTNYFPQLIETYIQKYVESIPDSTANAASRLVSKTMGDSLCFQLMLTKLANFAIKSPLMGMENTWAKLAEDYYLKGLTPWSDSTFLNNVRSEYNKVRFNRIGMKAYNLPLQDSLGRSVSLYNLGEKYTLLCLFEPSCGHCKTIIPSIYKTVYSAFSDKGLDVACIYIMTDRKEWLDFIKMHQLSGEHWHNLWDPNRNSFYWQYYDSSLTPGIYLLDENKRIIAKKLDVENLKDLLENLLKSKQ